MSNRSRRRPWLAALLALVVSGLGHVYLRRWARALAWYVAITATLVVLVPDAAVERVSAGDPPPLGDIAPALLVVAASVVDAYVLAVRNNREHDRQAVASASASGDAGRTDPAAGGEPDSDAVSAFERDATADGVTEPEVGEEMTQCPHCGRETNRSFDFCQWCAEPTDE